VEFADFQGGRCPIAVPFRALIFDTDKVTVASEIGFRPKCSQNFYPTSCQALIVLIWLDPSIPQILGFGNGTLLQLCNTLIRGLTYSTIIYASPQNAKGR
jgi:hypothetical protein